MDEHEAFAELRSLMNDGVDHGDPVAREAWWARAVRLVEDARDVWHDGMRDYASGFARHWSAPWRVRGLEPFVYAARAFPTATFDLDVSGGAVEHGEAIDELLAQPVLDRLVGLNLAGNRLTDVDASRLIDALPDGALTSFCLASNYITSVTTRRVASSPVFSGLRVLELGGAGVNHEGMEALAGSTTLSSLESLTLHTVIRNDVSLGSLASSPAMANLKELMLDHQFGPGVAGLLSASSCTFALERLDLRGCDVGDQGIISLAESPHGASLEEFVVPYNGIGDDGAVAIAEHMSLRVLLMSHNPASGMGARAIANSPRMSGLEEWNLQACPIGPLSAKAIAASPHMSNLESLDLRTTFIGDDGAAALAASKTLASLSTLSLGNCRMTSVGVEAFLNSPLLSTLDPFGLWVSQPDPEVQRRIKLSRFLSPTLADHFWAEASKAELKRVAGEYGVKGRSKLGLEELRAACRRAVEAHHAQ